MDSKIIFTVASFCTSVVVAITASANRAIAYEPIVTCEANYRQAYFDMKCWSEKLGKEMTIGGFVKAIESGEISR